MTSAFDLPDQLAAKADPALVSDDERHFAAVGESLEPSIADLSERLDSARQAPTGLYQEALERDQQVHRLTARLRTLRRFRLDLCLGRMVGADDLIDPDTFGDGIEGAVDRYVAMTRPTQRLVILTTT